MSITCSLHGGTSIHYICYYVIKINKQIGLYQFELAQIFSIVVVPIWLINTRYLGRKVTPFFKWRLFKILEPSTSECNGAIK